MNVSDPVGVSIWLAIPLIVGASMMLRDAWYRHQRTTRR